MFLTGVFRCTHEYLTIVAIMLDEPGQYLVKRHDPTQVSARPPNVQSEDLPMYCQGVSQHDLTGERSLGHCTALDG